MKKNLNFTLTDLIFIIIIFSILALISYHSINYLKIRSRDAKRVSDLQLVSSVINQQSENTKVYPQSNYNDLKNRLGFLLKELPKDPINNNHFNYKYYSNGTSYVLVSKLEGKNNSAINDGGKYNSKPLYYEIGSGPNWTSLIPKNLK